jgi:hypothetical protein
MKLIRKKAENQEQAQGVSAGFKGSSVDRRTFLRNSGANIINRCFASVSKFQYCNEGEP